MRANLTKQLVNLIVGGAIMANAGSVPANAQNLPGGSLISTITAGVPSGRVDEQFFFPVQLNPGDTQTYNEWGELRSPASTQGRTLLITVSGLGYDHRYWDFPAGPSFVNTAVNQGYAVLNLDKLSIGYSSRPPAAALGYQQDVFALHQIVTAVKIGALSHFGFAKVVLVGHSLGSTLIIPEAATFNDVSAIVLTGITHTPGSGIDTFFSDILPVAADPVLSLQGYPADYFTLKSGFLCSALLFSGNFVALHYRHQ